MLHLYPDHVTLAVRPGDITGDDAGERTGLLDDSLVIEGEEAEQKGCGW